MSESELTTVESAEATGPMNELLNTSVNPADEGDLVSGNVIALDTGVVYVDLPPMSTGIIFGREYIVARDVIKKMNIGDEVTAKVIDSENEDGYVELSLKEARQALTWSEAEKAMGAGKIFELPVKDANKGGLIVEWQGVQGFIPASQLKTDHYPRVHDGDKDKILDELKKLVGETLSLSIIASNPSEGKLIFSEKQHDEQERGALVERYAIGDIIEGEVTGAVDFGVFIKIEDGLEGLAHISELDWALVEDPRKLFAVGEMVKAKIIEIKDGQISLSVKQLKDNPWAGAAKRYKQGDTVNAVIIKHNKHGALASIEEGVAGLVHISEFESEDDLRNTLELGKTYPLKINLFDPGEQKMTFGFVRDEKEKKVSTNTS